MTSFQYQKLSIKQGLHPDHIFQQFLRQNMTVRQASLSEITFVTDI